MFKNILKNGALFFAVGVALALIAPPVATFLGAGILGEAAVAHAVATPVLWTGAFFGLFGAIDTALRPAFDKIFGDKPKDAEAAAVKVASAEGSKQVNITVLAPTQAMEFKSNHRETLTEKRVAISSSTEKTIP